MQDEGLPISDRRQARMDDVYQLENKSKLIAANFDARGSRPAHELGRRDCVTGES